MKKKINKFINYLKTEFKENWPVLIPIIISLVLHIFSLRELGFNYTLNSDDSSYIKSGIIFLQTGKITMHGVISAQIMPGMTFLIAIVALIFGTGVKLVAALKIIWMIMGLLTIYFLYKTIRLFNNKYVSVIPCIFLLTVDYVWMDNLILTETPFLLLSILLVYFTFKFADSPNTFNYICIIVFYILALFLKANIAIYPIFLVIYLLLKKFDFKFILKKCLIAGVILLFILTPWICRNYKVFNKFIPLTYGIGNPLLLGTYQGVGYPLDEELDYVTNVDDKMSADMKYYLENPEKKDYMTKYYSLEKDDMKAKYRMKEWWKRDKKSMIKSYFILKPYNLIYSSFYWREIFGYPVTKILKFRKLDIILCILSLLLIFIDKKKIKELLFLVTLYFSQILVYSYTFAFNRYAQTLHFIRYIVIGIAFCIVIEKLNKWRKKYESFNNSSSLQ